MGEENKTEQLMTPAEVAKRLGVSPVTVRSWVNKGWLKSQRTAGGHRRFRWEEVEKLVSNDPERLARNNDVRILVVDDDRQFRSFILDTLALLLPDAELRYAADGFQAGMVMASFKPDLVLFDYAMPGLNGAAVLHIIRDDSTYRNTQVVAITGLPSEENLYELKKAGAETILQKPISVQEIRLVLEKLNFIP